MADQRLEILIKLKDEATAAFAKIKTGLGGLNDAVKNAEGASTTFAKALGVAGGGIVALGGMALKAAADAEQTKISFTTMLGSAEKAQKFMKYLASFAAKTPFDLKGLETSSKQLLAYGSTQDNVLKQLKVLGDISAGVGQDKLPQLILAFGQTQAATKLTGNELRQFTEAGVPIIDALAAHFGVAKDAIAGMVSDGAVKFKDVEAALTSLTEKGGKFNDLMKAQSESLTGKISNLGDAWDAFLRGQGAILLDWGKQFTDWLIYVVTTIFPMVIEKIQQVTKWFMEHKEALIIVAGAIIGALVPAIYAAASSFAALAISLGPFMIAGAVIAGIIAAIYYVATHWDELKAKAKAVWDAIANKMKEVWATITNAFNSGVNFMTNLWETGLNTIGKLWHDAWTGMSNVLSDIWNGIKNTVISGINWVIDKINNFIQMVNRASAAAAGVVGLSAPQISEIPRLANGGIVDRPTMAMIGEAGPEAVVPLNRSKLSGLGIGGGITINVYGDVSGDDLVDKTAKALVKRLQLSTAIV